MILLNRCFHCEAIHDDAHAGSNAYSARSLETTKDALLSLLLVYTTSGNIGGVAHIALDVPSYIYIYIYLFIYLFILYPSLAKVGRSHKSKSVSNRKLEQIMRALN